MAMIDTRYASFEATLRRLWGRVAGSSLLPGDIELISIERVAALVEVSVKYADDETCVFVADIPDHYVANDGLSAQPIDPAEHWATWAVLVPLVEVLQTGAVKRHAPDERGTRRITLSD